NSLRYLSVPEKGPPSARRLYAQRIDQNLNCHSTVIYRNAACYDGTKCRDFNASREKLAIVTNLLFVTMKTLGGM
ncbi:hypothetical protein THAOC_11211, partial [Thalassiosira oceanica]